MIRIETTRYFSHGKYSDPLGAQRHVDRLREQHPDREYTLLVNMRAAYYKFAVAQVDYVTTNVPEPEDLKMPPAPETTFFRRIEDFYAASHAWDQELAQHRGDFKALLTRKMNS